MSNIIPKKNLVSTEMRVWAFSANWSFDLVLISVLACCKYMNLVMIYLYYIWTYDYKRCARFLPTKWPDPLTFSPFPCHWLWTILWTWHMEITHKTNVHKKKKELTRRPKNPMESNVLLLRPLNRKKKFLLNSKGNLQQANQALTKKQESKDMKIDPKVWGFLKIFFFFAKNRR